MNKNVSKQKTKLENAIIDTVREEFFVIKRRSFWYFVGGLVSSLVAYFGLTYATIQKTATELMKDERVVQAVETMTNRARQVETDSDAISQLRKKLEANDRTLSVLAAGHSEKFKEGADVAFDLDIPAIVLVQGTLFAVTPPGMEFRKDALGARLDLSVNGKICNATILKAEDVAGQGERALNATCLVSVSSGPVTAAIRGTAGVLGSYDYSYRLTYVALRAGSCLDANTGLAC